MDDENEYDETEDYREQDYQSRYRDHKQEKQERPYE